MISGILAFFCVSTIIFCSRNSWIKVDIILENSTNFESKVFFQNVISEDFYIANSQTKFDIWNIEIPKINLKANISEGTSPEILDKSVGHFEETATFNGNIGLAAHNRGYNVNYFENLKELETGDEIFYEYKGNKREYIVKTRDIIKETDWSYLEKSENNILTLITCVEDMPEYRRCIQAIEKKEE